MSYVLRVRPWPVRLCNYYRHFRAIAMPPWKAAQCAVYMLALCSSHRIQERAESKSR
jgi:hypothetical protein